MADVTVLNTGSRRAPPRIDETKVSPALQNLFAGWRLSLKEPFRGLTANGEIERGLFPLRKTGVSIQPMIDAARAFLNSLDRNQRAAVHYDVNSETWRTWSNIHRNLMRHGLCLAELGDQQRELVFDVLRAGLGVRAFETARSAMKLNEHLAELTRLPDEFGEFYYWISIFRALRRCAMGLAARWTSLQHQLLCAWRPSGLVADASWLRTCARRI